ncbi:MAG: hypothetical protein ABR548_00045 [Actinomycetota bacterium]|nr:hypothetical protein [Actinomycetota bacterium]
MRRRFAFVLMALAACTRGAPAPTPAASGSPRPPSLEFLAQNFELPAGRDHAVRFGFEAAEPGVRVIATFPDTGAIVSACALGSIDGAIPDAAGQECRSELPSGVREEVVRPGGVAAVVLWVQTGAAVTANLRLEFAQGGRHVAIRLPVLRASTDPVRCRDNACNPVFEVRPVHGGPFTASAAWTDGRARLALLEGRVLARSFTATGVPYVVAAEDESASRATIRTRMSAPAEYALVVDRNASTIGNMRIDATWA